MAKECSYSTPGEGGTVTEIVNATCETVGYIKEICDCGCGTIISQTEISKTDHSDEVIAYKPSSCLEDGFETIKCSVCNRQQTTTIAALGHNFGTPVSKNDATCQRGNTLIATCSRCSTTDITYDDNTTDHDFTIAGKVTTEPTCTSPGSQTYWCSKDTNCLATTSKTIPALGHNMQKTGEYVSATCQHGGYDKTQCTRCPETGTVNESDPISHNYATFIKTVSPATCRKLADNKYKCTMCDDYTIVSEGSYADHNWSSWSESIKAWCDSSGQNIRSCQTTGCNETDTQSIPKDPNKHEEVEVPGYDATCTTNGLTSGAECKRCHTILEAQEIIAAYGHSEIPAVTKVPGPGVQGERTYTCTKCGVITRTEIIPATPLAQYKVTINHVRKDNDELIKSIDTYFSDGTICEIFDYKYEPAGYEFDEESAPSDFPVTQDTIITLYYYKLATIITNHYAKNQAQTLLGSNIHEGNRFRVGTEIDLTQFANVYPNYTYSNNSGVSSDNELYIIQDGTNEINYFYTPSFETTYTITCNYYKGLTTDESLLYTSVDHSGLKQNDTFNPFDKIIVIPGYEYYSCSETDPFSVTVNKSVDYFYKEVKSYTLTVYHEDIDNKGVSIATAVPHYGIREGTAIKPADYQLTDEYLPEGWVYVEGTSIEKLTSDNSITCYYKKSTQSFTIYKKSVYGGKEINGSVQKPQGTNIPDTKTLFDKYIEDGINKYTLDKTEPAAIENLSSNIEVTATYRGYYGYKIKYVYIDTNTDIQPPEEMVYQSTPQWRFDENGSAPKINGFVSTGSVRINEDYEQKIESLGVITLENEETIIEYLYTTSSKLIIQFVDYYTNEIFKTENAEATNPFIIPASKENEILDNGYRINGVKINDNTDVYFGGSYTLDLSKINIITYLCIPAFTNFNNETIKTGKTISIKYDLYRNNLTPTYTISQDSAILSVAKNETDISLFAYNAGIATLTLTLGNYTETHTYTVQYEDTPQSIALGVGLTKELPYRESEHTLDYDGELCASISHPDDTYILTGTKKQLLQQTIIVRNKDPKYVITKLYITCTETIYKVTYQYKNEATGQSIKSSRQESFARGQQVVVNLDSLLYFIEGYQLVAIEKDGEKTNDNIDFTLEADTTITLWYKTTTHTHNFDKYVRTIAPSCITQGYELWSCSCEETQQKNIKEALGHDWSNWIVTIEPTETAPGQETRTCNRCDTKENKIKDATGVPIEDIDSGIILQSKEEDYYPTTTYDMIIVSKTNTDKLINIGAAAPSTLSEGSIYIEGGISVKSNLNSGWLRRTKDGTNRRISPKTTVDLIVLNQNNAKAFIMEPSAPTGIPGPAGTLYFVIGE